jgi:hypothetical protein
MLRTILETCFMISVNVSRVITIFQMIVSVGNVIYHVQNVTVAKRMNATYAKKVEYFKAWVPIRYVYVLRDFMIFI